VMEICRFRASGVSLCEMYLWQHEVDKHHCHHVQSCDLVKSWLWYRYMQKYVPSWMPKQLR